MICSKKMLVVTLPGYGIELNFNRIDTSWWEYTNSYQFCQNLVLKLKRPPKNAIYWTPTFVLSVRVSSILSVELNLCTKTTSVFMIFSANLCSLKLQSSNSLITFLILQKCFFHQPHASVFSCVCHASVMCVSCMCHVSVMWDIFPNILLCVCSTFQVILELLTSLEHLDESRANPSIVRVMYLFNILLVHEST